MPLDAICLSAVKGELERKITGLKIDKVQQPERDEILISLRGIGVSSKIIISAGSGDARIHETSLQYENPDSPPMFCMLLRKHLLGAKILGITQPHLERQLDISVLAPDALGEMSEKHIVLELMGTRSNIILTDSDGIIIDCLRRVDSEMSRIRQVQPGMLYRMPPAQSKRDPLEISRDEFLQLCSDGKSADKLLLDTFCGLSPLICREIAFRAFGRTDAVSSEDPEKLADAFFAFTDDIKNGKLVPYLVSELNGKPSDFSFTEITQYEDSRIVKREDSFSQLLETYYSRRASAERVKQRSAAMTKTVKNALDRVYRKLTNQRTELMNAVDRELMRRRGDIITANLWNMKKGQTVLHAVDFYSDDGAECDIPLDPLKTPQQNAAKYYKDYNKAKNAEKYLTEQIGIAEREEQYLLSVLDEISRAEGERDLTEIRNELTDSGYIRQQKTQKRVKRAPSKPMRFVSSTGYEILVGKNNTQNDELTLKNSYKTDIWLHAQKIHGSHVVISTLGGEPDDTTLNEAASLAAFFSQGSDSGKVAVDYTLIKYVKKPAGGKPGMVIYTNQKTLIAKPDETLTEKLREKQK